MKARLALLSCLVLWTAPSAAQMYKWVDEKGVTHYSEKPPPGRKAQQIQAAPAAPPAAAPPSDPSSAASSTWSDKERDFRRRSIERDEADAKRKKKEEDEKYRVAMRRELCADARGAVAAMSEQRPVYWINQQGEREYLKDEDRPEAMRRAKEKVQEYCKPQ